MELDLNELIPNNHKVVKLFCKANWHKFESNIYIDSSSGYDVARVKSPIFTKVLSKALRESGVDITDSGQVRNTTTKEFRALTSAIEDQLRIFGLQCDLNRGIMNIYGPLMDIIRGLSQCKMTPKDATKKSTEYDFITKDQYQTNVMDLIFDFV